MQNKNIIKLNSYLLFSILFNFHHSEALLDSQAYADELKNTKTPTYIKQKELTIPSVHYKQNRPITKDTGVYIDLDIQVKSSSKMSPMEAALLQDIKYGRKIDFEKITEVWLDHYLKLYNKKHGTQYTIEQVKSIINQEILKGIETKDPHDFKVQYEKNIINKHNISEIKYNIDYSNPLEPILNGKLQCSSGTKCRAFLDRMSLPPNEYQKYSPLFIFQPGHIANAYPTADGQLNAVESVLDGRALKRFGEFKDIEASGLPIRIVDAAEFIVFDIFKPYMKIEQQKRLEHSILRRSALKLGYDLEKTEQLVSKYKEKHKDSLGYRPFSFGVPTTGSGDKSRPHVDEKDARKQDLPLAEYHDAPKTAPTLSKKKQAPKVVTKENELAFKELLSKIKNLSVPYSSNPNSSYWKNLDSAKNLVIDSYDRFPSLILLEIDRLKKAGGETWYKTLGFEDSFLMHVLKSASGNISRDMTIEVGELESLFKFTKYGKELLLNAIEHRARLGSRQAYLKQLEIIKDKNEDPDVRLRAIDPYIFAHRDELNQLAEVVDSLRGSSRLYSQKKQIISELLEDYDLSFTHIPQHPIP